jgi:hypothetical protein
MLHRRDAMLRLGQLGGATWALPALMQAEKARGALVGEARDSSGAGGLAETDAAKRSGKGRAKSCILVYLWGGPPQQDMWDMKPEAPEGIRSVFQPIDTNVPGIQICDQMPLLARQADKFALIRSLTHDSNNHEPSVYRTLTGRSNPSLAVPRNQRTRQDFPSIGSVVANFTPSSGLPSCVTVPRPIGHDGVTYAGTHGGFLGPKCDPMEMAAAADVNAPATHSLELPTGLEGSRLLARRGLLETIERDQRRLDALAVGSSIDAFREQAYRMLADPAAKRAFDLADEKDEVRDRYGRNEYGESFLLARRMVEAGVRFVTVVWLYVCPNGKVANVWDTHGGTGNLGSVSGFEMLKEKYCLPPLDRGLSALLEDLGESGLLDETLVAAYGEFGRTPKINNAGGREHWGMCQSVLMAGGGIRGGQVYGASDRQAAYPKEKGISPEDLLATIYHGLGLSPEMEIHDPQGRPHRLCDGRPVLDLF